MGGAEKDVYTQSLLRMAECAVAWKELGENSRSAELGGRQGGVVVLVVVCCCCVCCVVWRIAATGWGSARAASGRI